ncbi:MAG TPA: LuxR C-terminal-related transcriptional regulator [Pyrinomonadaceae bacterium]|nr:LuxR C-terminal-related transcriptional regulator [Pyrinomonadaceae bacterium]
MKPDEIRRLLDSTGDPAFAVESEGTIMAWNAAAESLFGRSAAEAVGQSCGDMLKGRDECGDFCSENCAVRQSIENHRPIGNFDLEVETAKGRQWCNVSVLTADDSGSTRPLAIHVVRPIDLRKRLEILVRDFVVTNTSVTPESAVALISSTRAPAKDAELSPREVEILRLLAQGAASKAVGAKLNISAATVNNHVQHILKKLGAHNRLEAIRRAEYAGLI